jgi:cysteine desulfuration protein SufE
MTKLDKIIQQFQSLEPDWRLQLLLDYSEKLPPLPDEFREARDAEIGRVEECQTPVFLYVYLNNGRISIQADVASDAPTVKGFVSILVQAFNGAPPEEVQNMPANILHEMGIANIIGMVRIQGLSAVIRNMKGRVLKAISS